MELIGTSDTGLIKINTTPNQKLALLRKQPNYIIESYREQLGLPDTTPLDRVRQMIANGRNGDTVIGMDVFFGKNAQCINDAIIMKLNMRNTTTHIQPVEIVGASAAPTQVNIVSTRQFSIVGSV